MTPPKPWRYSGAVLRTKKGTNKLNPSILSRRSHITNQMGSFVQDQWLGKKIFFDILMCHWTRAPQKSMACWWGCCAREKNQKKGQPSTSWSNSLCHHVFPCPLLTQLECLSYHYWHNWLKYIKQEREQQPKYGNQTEKKPTGKIPPHTSEAETDFTSKIKKAQGIPQKPHHLIHSGQARPYQNLTESSSAVKVNTTGFTLILASYQGWFR